MASVLCVVWADPDRCHKVRFGCSHESHALLLSSSYARAAMSAQLPVFYTTTKAYWIWVIFPFVQWQKAPPKSERMPEKKPVPESKTRERSATAACLR
mgnify:CR=1 FL=1